MTPTAQRPPAQVLRRGQRSARVRPLTAVACSAARAPMAGCGGGCIRHRNVQPAFASCILLGIVAGVMPVAALRLDLLACSAPITSSVPPHWQNGALQEVSTLSPL
jgi:hypothetical protein